MSKIETLTPEQERQFVEWRARWLAIGTSTERADRPRTQAAINAMYERIGKPVPRFIWCESPATATLCIALLRELPESKVSLWASLRDSLWASLRDSLGTSLRASLGDSLRASLGDSLRDSLWASLRASLGDSLGTSLWASLRDSLGTSLWASWWGQHEAHWVAYYRFCEDVLGVSYERSADLQLWSELAQSCGWWIPYENYCVCCERPTVQMLDENGRIHGETGPAMAFADGWKVYAWHGVRLADSRVVESPESLSADDILKEPNAEVRRVMIERVGHERFLALTGAQPIHEDRFGRLYRIDLVDDEPLVLVEVVNSTPEPDGHSKHYFLRVHPECRPLLLDGTVGELQEMTAHAAVASTFGLRAEEYQPESES